MLKVDGKELAFLQEVRTAEDALFNEESCSVKKIFGLGDDKFDLKAEFIAQELAAKA